MLLVVSPCLHSVNTLFPSRGVGACRSRPVTRITILDTLALFAASLIRTVLSVRTVDYSCFFTVRCSGFVLASRP